VALAALALVVFGAIECPPLEPTNNQARVNIAELFFVLSQMPLLSSILRKV